MVAIRLLAYVQLYLAKESVSCLPQPWERYLPEYKALANKKNVTRSPSQTQRGFDKVLEIVGTPAKACVARGKPRGRATGETQPKKETYPIIFKKKKAATSESNSILSGSDSAGQISESQRIDALIKQVQRTLEKFNLTPAEFSEMLINSS